MSGDLKKIVEYAEEFLEKSLESKIFLDLLDQAGLKIEHASKNDCLIYNDMPSTSYIKQTHSNDSLCF